MADIHGLKPVRPVTPYNVTAQIRGDIREITRREIAEIGVETIGAETPAGAQEKVDVSAASLTAAIAAAKAELQAADDTKAALVHTHDNRYYLKAQVDAAVAGKAATVHAHDDRYYTESEVDAALGGKAAAVHNHNDLYYSEVEIDGMLATKAANVHLHDDRYYTEDEVDALLLGVGGGSGEDWTPVNASTTVKGIVELATSTETTTGTDATRAVTPAGVKAALDAKTASDMSTYEAKRGADDNYVTDAEKTKLANLSGTNTGDQDLSGYAPAVQTINPQTGTTYTLVAGDAGKLVTCTNAAAITVTLPQDSDATFVTGARVDVIVLGAGLVTFVAGAGATVNGTPSLVMRAQYGAATCIKRAANTWLIVGDLA